MTHPTANVGSWLVALDCLVFLVKGPNFGNLIRQSRLSECAGRPEPNSMLTSMPTGIHIESLCFKLVDRPVEIPLIPERYGIVGLKFREIH